MEAKTGLGSLARSIEDDLGLDDLRAEALRLPAEALEELGAGELLRDAGVVDDEQVAASAPARGFMSSTTRAELGPGRVQGGGEPRRAPAR